VLRVAWECDCGIASGNGGLVMNYASEVVQQVAELNQEIHATGDSQAEKLVRDFFIWAHIAGDAVQRMKVAQRLMRKRGIKRSVAANICRMDAQSRAAVARAPAVGG